MHSHTLLKYLLKMFIRFWNTLSKSSDVIVLPLKLLLPYWTLVQMLLTKVQMLLNLVQMLLTMVQMLLNLVQMLLTMVQMLPTMVQMLLTMVQTLLNLVQILLNTSYCSKNYTKLCHILLSMIQTLLTSTQTFWTHPLNYSDFLVHPPETLIFYLTQRFRLYRSS